MHRDSDFYTTHLQIILHRYNSASAHRLYRTGARITETTESGRFYLETQHVPAHERTTTILSAKPAKRKNMASRRQEVHSVQPYDIHRQGGKKDTTGVNIQWGKWQEVSLDTLEVSEQG